MWEGEVLKAFLLRHDKLTRQKKNWTKQQQQKTNGK